MVHLELGLELGHLPTKGRGRFMFGGSGRVECAKDSLNSLNALNVANSGLNYHAQVHKRTGLGSERRGGQRAMRVGVRAQRAPGV